MNFTREPVIETVITPREGCKLLVRNSKSSGQEDYYVEAIEVVSFGHSFFFRSQERPKAFLVPVSDYEVLEVKETRMTLKNVSGDRSIKIGGGREAPPARQQSSSEEGEPAPEKGGPDRKRERRRRGRRGRDRYERETKEAPKEETVTEMVVAEETKIEEKAPSFISKLFPPPSTLIRESLERYKTSENEEENLEKTLYDEPLFDHPEPNSEEENEE